MEVSEINKLKSEMSTFDFDEVRMRAGEEGKEDDVALAANTGETVERSASPKRRETRLQQKRRLLAMCAHHADEFDSKMLAKIGAALMK